MRGKNPNEDMTMERSRKTMFLAEETARYRTSGRVELGMFSDLQEL